VAQMARSGAIVGGHSELSGISCQAFGKCLDRPLNTSSIAVHVGGIKACIRNTCQGNPALLHSCRQEERPSGQTDRLNFNDFGCSSSP